MSEPKDVRDHEFEEDERNALRNFWEIREMPIPGIDDEIGEEE